MRKTALILMFLGAAVGVGLAQRSGRWRWGQGGGDTGIVYTEGRVPVNMDTVRTARETESGSTGTPAWTNSPGFEKDVFTFVRVIYRRAANSADVSATSSPRGWITDYPDSDLNLSYRLQQVTSMKVDPDARVLRLTDPALFDYPWIYMVEPGGLALKEEEIPVLRKYLLNGGVLMADDFWGQKQWDNFARSIKRVLPEREFSELPMDHPLFHSVFDLKGPRNSLQTPNIMQGTRSLQPGSREYGVTWERYHDDYDNYDESGRAAHDMHVRAIFDDKAHIMVLATHNCDNGDSWEREGENDGFFHEFSEKRGFPLGINVVFYLMTH
ncbi:MAG TPA: DUF4159 domain-containing protein [Candidatus Dormibacteraeota bacterium]|nr:DUF4159 domain-containing protein [Candidatus Dormibacteraeota bacterium]